MTIFEQAIATIMAACPNLTSNGFERPENPNFIQYRENLRHPLCVHEFEVALAWLSYVPKVPRGGEDSYQLKHIAEDWSGVYVSNGIFIAASIHAEFRAEHQSGYCNALIGVGSAKHWPIRPDGNYQWLRRQHRVKGVIESPPRPVWKVS
jgi:hypothetical protein